MISRVTSWPRLIGTAAPGRLADLDEGATASSSAEEAVDGGGGTGAVVGQRDVRGEVISGGVNEVVGAHGAGVLEGEVGKVGGVDLAGTEILGGTDGATPVDEDRLALEVCAVETVDRDGEGLGSGGRAGGNACRNGADLVLADDAVGGESALFVRVEGRGAEVANLGPEIGEVAKLRGNVVVATEGCGVKGDRSGGLTGHVDDACDLVAEDERVLQNGSAGRAVLPIGQVGATDAAVFHADTDLAGAGFGIGKLSDLEFFGGDYNCFHTSSLEHVDDAEDAHGKDGDGRDHKQHLKPGAVLNPGIGVRLGKVERGDGDNHEIDGVERATEEHEDQRRLEDSDGTCPQQREDDHEDAHDLVALFWSVQS